MTHAPVKADRLTALAERLERATGPDRLLDAAIKVATTPVESSADDLIYLKETDFSDRCAPGTYWRKSRSGASLQTAGEFTASLDVALGFAKRALPAGDAITIGLNIHHRKWVASINRLHENGTPYSVAWGDAPEGAPALALCRAVVRALAALDNLET